MQFRGPKDLEPFTKFYEKSTGYEPFQHTAVDEIPRLRSGKYIMPLCIRSKMDEIWTREPYLFFSVFFLFLRHVMYLFPRILFHLRALWVSDGPHLNMEIFRETSQKIRHILRLIEIERIWTKIRMSKNRNFHKGARNASVWTSSLASVSLGETSNF